MKIARSLWPAVDEAPASGWICAGTARAPLGSIDTLRAGRECDHGFWRRLLGARTPFGTLASTARCTMHVGFPDGAAVDLVAWRLDMAHRATQRAARARPVVQCGEDRIYGTPPARPALRPT